MTFTAVEFNLETKQRLNRIAANPNPSPAHRPSLVKQSWTWGRTLDRAAALDSARSVFAFVGIGASLAYMGTMPPYLVPVAAVLMGGAWYADYLRHF